MMHIIMHIIVVMHIIDVVPIDAYTYYCFDSYDLCYIVFMHMIVMMDIDAYSYYCLLNMIMHIYCYYA